MMRKSVNKQVVAVDIDDVLVAEAEFIVNFSNKHWGHTLSLEDYREHWAQMWKVDNDEVERRADELIHYFADFRLLEDVHEALEKLAKKYRLIIITSRRQIVKNQTLKWLNENFGDVFEEIHFTGIWDGPLENAHKQTKAELASKLGIDYLIDDQAKHCFGAAEVGIKAVLFGDYAESRHLTLPEGVTRCKNWREVLEYFDAQS